MRRHSSARVALILALALAAAACGGKGEEQAGRNPAVPAGGGGTPTIVPAPGGSPITLPTAAGTPSPGATGAPGGGTTGTRGGGGTKARPTPTLDPNYKGDVGITENSIKIGVIYPQSGSFAPLFDQYPKIYRAAFNDINDREGGIFGRKLELVTGDEDDSASQAQAAARQMATTAFGVTTALQEVTVVDFNERARVPTMTLLGTITPGALHGKYPYSFHMGTPPGYMEVRNGASRIHKAFPKMVDRVAFVTTPDIYPGAIKAFTEAAKRHGVTVVHVEKLALNQAQCLNSVSNVQSKNPKIVYIHSSSLEAGCFFRDARSAGFRPQWTGRLAQLTNTASGNSNDGMVGVTYLRGLKSKEGQRLLATYKKYYPNEQFVDIEPNILAWAAAQMWILWLKALGPQPTRAGFPGVVETAGPFESGLLGPQRFSPGIHVGSEHTIAGIVRDGNVVITDDVWRKTYDGITDPPFFPFR